MKQLASDSEGQGHMMRPGSGMIRDPCKGAYNSGKPGKHGNLREFVNYGKLGEFKIYLGNLSDAVYCYMILSLGHRVVCIIVSNSSIN